MEQKLKRIINRVDKIKGWFNERQMEVLYPFVKNLEPNSLLVEVGTAYGRSTMFYSLTNPKIDIVTFDPQILVDKKVLDRPNVEFYPVTSEEMAKGWDDPVDYLFIDGDHLYDGVKTDIDCWLPHLVPGGLITFHDYAPNFPGVYKAVNELKKSKKVKFLSGKESVAILRKND